MTEANPPLPQSAFSVGNPIEGLNNADRCVLVLGQDEASGKTVTDVARAAGISVYRAGIALSRLEEFGYADRDWGSQGPSKKYARHYWLTAHGSARKRVVIDTQKIEKHLKGKEPTK